MTAMCFTAIAEGKHEQHRKKYRIIIVLIDPYLFINKFDAQNTLIYVAIYQKFMAHCQIVCDVDRAKCCLIKLSD